MKLSIVTSLGSNYDALTFTTTHVGYGVDLFYFLRHSASGFSTFGTISPSGVVGDRFGVGFNSHAIHFLRR